MKTYDVLIVGGGVSGTSLLYTLSNYTNVKNICLIEKYGELAQVNSHGMNNSQTLHFGDIETNYTLEKATKVKKDADLVKYYVENARKKGEKHLFSKYTKMVLAVGNKEVERLHQRYVDFKKLFPEIKELDKKDIGKWEPKVLEGRDPNQKILGMGSSEGYTIDYGNLARSFAKNAQKKGKKIDILLNTQLRSIRKDAHYVVGTNKGVISAKVVIIAAGGHSLLLAHELGYGKDYAILSVAGSFYTAPKYLNGKVYTMQVDKLPFAAIHGDPDVHNKDETRFGPTAKAIPFLERYKASSFFEYFKIFGLRWSAVITPFKILSDPTIFKYILKNTLYDVPFIGPRMFIKEVKQIVPSIKLSELHFAHKVGGTRPQIMNTKTRSLEMGEAKIKGDNIIFNITPSPGASTCLGNAKRDAFEVVKFLGKKYSFNEKKFLKDLS